MTLDITTKGDAETAKALFTFIVLMDNYFPFRHLKVKEKKNDKIHKKKKHD